jgi:putative FmdB family regulatory protein
MPIYEYECRKCQAHIEVFQKFSDKPIAKCRKCGGRLEKLLSASAIRFKGSGWYVTDYSDGRKKSAAKRDAETSSTGDMKGDDKSKDTSPSKSTSDKASSPKKPSGD